MPYRILAISDDDGLRASREMVLRSEGFDVESHSSQAFLQIARVRSFDLTILCQSIPADRAAFIADKLRRSHPGIRVLRVNPFRTSEPRDDTDSEVLAGPYALLCAIERLLHHKPHTSPHLPVLQL